MNPRFYNSNAAAEHYLGIRWPRAIWAAVLEQAIRDIVEGPAAFERSARTYSEQVERDIRAAAEHWIADEANEPRRFVWVCEQLGVSPDAVRRSIKARRT